MKRFASVSVLAALVALGAGCARCGGADSEGSSSGSVEAPAAGLSVEDSKKVLAKVGERTITLGDFAGVLERMGPYERMRYQAPERRKELLDDMITVELLAAEAVAKGYDKDPVTELELRSALRDAMLAELRKDAPKPESLPIDDIRAWYKEHTEMFRDPERRRISAIAVKTPAQAAAVITEMQRDSSAIHFGQLVRERSVLEDAKADVPVDLAGDLGIVSPPGDPRGVNKRAPEPVRAAAYALSKVGTVSAEPLAADGLFYVLRLVQVLEARERTFEEAERSIRVRLAQEALTKREDEFVKELAQKIPVTIDEAALAKVRSAPAPGGDALTPPDSGPP